MTLDLWCGAGTIWTQLSALGYLRVGGKIHVGGLSPDNLSKVLKSLALHVQDHPQWDPIRLSGDYILIGKNPKFNRNVLSWRDDPFIDPSGTEITNDILSDALSPFPGEIVRHMGDKTWFAPDYKI